MLCKGYLSLIKAIMRKKIFNPNTSSEQQGSEIINTHEPPE